MAIIMKLALFFLLVGVFVLAGCNTLAKTSDRDVTVVDYEGLVRLLNDEKRPVIVIDVRPADRFATGRLPMAINIPLPELRPNDPRLAEAHHLVVYSRGLGDPLSRAAAKRLMVQGYANVHDFAGGLELWQRMMQVEEARQ